MSGFNGSGTWVLSAAGLPYVSGTVIASTVANQLNTDLAAGLSNTICRDGQSTTTAIIPFLLGITASTINEVTASAGVPIQGSRANPATNAAAGYVGEFFETIVLDSSPVSVSNGVDKTIASINLTTGDWDVCGNIVTSPGAGTTTSQIAIGINTVLDTLPAVEQRFQSGAAIPANGRTSGSISKRRISISTNTTVYLVANISFAVSTMGCCGFINARRVR